MDKAIKLTMTSGKEILITVNNEAKHTIKADERTISADKIYDILAYTEGDNYTVSVENENGEDSNVLDFFAELLTDITSKVNALILDEISGI